jgi:hypothetical protein
MNIDDQISKALLETHPQDFSIIIQYAKWIRVRRLVNNVFYFQSRLIRPYKRQVHWVGKQP